MGKPTENEQKKAEEAMDYLSKYIQDHVYDIATGTIDTWRKVHFNVHDYHERLSCDGKRKRYLGPGRYEISSADDDE